MEQAKYTYSFKDHSENVCADLMVECIGGVAQVSTYYCQEYYQNLGQTLDLGSLVIYCGQHNRVGLCWIDESEKARQERESRESRESKEEREKGRSRKSESSVLEGTQGGERSRKTPRLRSKAGIIALAAVGAIALAAIIAVAGCRKHTSAAALVGASTPAAVLQTAEVTSYRLNMRSGPGVNSNALKTLRQGDMLTVTGGEQNGWLPVEHKGTQGWVSADRVRANAGVKPAADGAETSGFNATHKIVTNDGTNLRLRNGQSFRGTQIGSLDNGSYVQVLETGDSAVDGDGNRGSWMRVVTPAGLSGWCFGAYLSPLAQTANTAQSEGDYAIRPVPTGVYINVQQEGKEKWQMVLFVFIAAAAAAAAAVIIAAVWRKQRITAYIKSGKVNFTNGKFDEAIKDYSAAIDLDKKNAYPDAYTNRGNAYLMRGARNPDDYNKALENYNKAFDDYNMRIDLDPNAWAYYHRGRAYHGKKDFDRALADYSKAIDLDRNEANFYLFRGSAHYEKARQSYFSRIERYEKAKMYNHAIAVRKLLDAGYEDAIKDYKRAVDIAKDDTEIQENLEICRESLDASHQKANACANLAKSWAEMGFDVDIANSGVAFYNQGNYSQAIEYFSEAIMQNPENAAYHHARGLAYERSGVYSQAITDFKEAERIAPDNDEYRKAVSQAEALHNQKCLEKIHAEMESIKAAHPGLNWNIVNNF